MIIVLAVAIGAVVSLVSDPRTYGTFSDATAQPEQSFEIIGALDTTSAIVYDAFNNPDEFSFFMYDENKVKKQVIVSKPKPQDFERSVQVVVGGKMQDDVFYADNILLKCPSKYEGQGGDQAAKYMMKE